MKTADELTALTIDFLAEHTNEAAAAVVLGVIWHLIWERPKHQRKPAEFSHDETSQTIPEKSRQTQLRGNLKSELQLVLNKNEELEKIVLELQSELERKDHISSFSPTRAYIPFGTQHNARKKIHKAGFISTTIGMTTNEFDALASCWALLVFGFCLISKRRTRQRFNPLSATVVVLEKIHRAANGYTQEAILPALIKIWLYLSKEFQEMYSRITDPESSSGRVIATARETFGSHTETVVASIETIVCDRILPVSAQLTKHGAEYTHRVVNTLSAIEMPKWKEQPPTVLLSDHEESIQALETSLEQNESQRKALEEKVSGFEQALKGKEILLYEERMKTRSAKLEAAKVTLEREETRRKESRDTEASARAAVFEDQRRILRNFLTEHIQSRQQQERLRRIEEKNAPKKSTLVLPDPILQGFASAMYINNVSDLSGDQANSSDQRIRGNTGDFVMDSRDDAIDEDDYYGNPNEMRLLEIKEQFLRSKTTASSLRPSHIDPRDGNKASTGSLLWSAANQATVAKDCAPKNHISTRATSSQEPSSWMEDPASLMCDWRMNGNEEETRE